MSEKEIQEQEDNKYLDWVPGFVRSDFVRKFIALFFACLVYFTVTIKVGETINIQSIPVKINLPLGLVNKDTEINKVRVTLRGSKRALNSVTQSDIKIRLNVRSDRFVPSLPYNLKINLSDIQTPIGTRPVAVTPDFLTLNLEEQESKEVIVQPRFDSKKKLPRDLAVGKVKLNPSMVTITGPKSALEGVETVPTMPIPLDKYTVESFEYQVKVAGFPGAKVVPNEVQAEVEIKKEYRKKTFKSIPIRILGSSGRQNLKVELVTSPHADITVSGVKGKVAALKPEIIKPYVDISGLDKPGNYMVDVRCWIDVQGIIVEKIYPKQVQIKITKK